MPFGFDFEPGISGPIVENKIRQDIRDLEHRAIVEASRLPPHGVQLARLQEFAHGLIDLSEVLQNEPDFLLQNPGRVVAFLRQCKSVPLDNYR
jgi:hypothetical protein